MAAENIFAEMLVRVRGASDALIAAGVLPAGIDQSRVSVEPPRDPAHGDMATNAAMVLAKDAGKKPRELAEAITEKLRGDPLVEKVDVAGPGFINLTLKPTAWIEALQTAVRLGTRYGSSDIGGGTAVNVEYVSANPTGPMHVGHGRGAVFGDALANLLAFTGFNVTREYYINDAGAQVDVLARSAYLRYREALGEEIGIIPEGLYPGDYLKPVGKALAGRYGESLLHKPDAEWLGPVREVAVAMMMRMIRRDLSTLNIKHKKFFSERSLIGGPRPVKSWPPPLMLAVIEARSIYPRWGKSRLGPIVRSKGFNFSDTTIGRIIGTLIARDKVAETIEEMRARGLVYEGRLPPPKGAPVEDWEDREQTLFRSTAFGDDVDRALKKSDGSYTYFASDIAYHRSKLERGFRAFIDVWGADHAGYVKRMQAAVTALSDRSVELDIKLIQLVKLLRGGQAVTMSKRAGELVTLREVVDEVGRDAVRFMMLFRKNDAVLDFDLAKVIEQSRDNPVFYVQYAHARGMSVFRNAKAIFSDLPENIAELVNVTELNFLSDPAELALMRQIALYPRVVEGAALAHEPHRIAFYLFDLASEFHALWTLGNASPHLRFIIQNDRHMTAARLVLVQGVVAVLASGLALLGVEAPDEMR
jgi:arginyl-tRNA synthetase